MLEEGGEMCRVMQVTALEKAESTAVGFSPHA
jgi:hypothetical protein